MHISYHAHDYSYTPVKWLLIMEPHYSTEDIIQNNWSTVGLKPNGFASQYIIGPSDIINPKYYWIYYDENKKRIKDNV